MPSHMASGMSAVPLLSTTVVPAPTVTVSPESRILLHLVQCASATQPYAMHVAGEACDVLSIVMSERIEKVCINIQVDCRLFLLFLH